VDELCRDIDENDGILRDQNEVQTRESGENMEVLCENQVCKFVIFFDL
jgi:hypothetical protein